MIIFGGESGNNQGDDSAALADGASYNLGTKTWRTISPDPYGGRTKASAVWSGSEMLIVGGQSFSTVDTPTDRIDAYNPSTGQWRIATRMPFIINPGERVSAVWITDSLFAITKQLNPDHSVSTALWEWSTNQWKQRPADPSADEIKGFVSAGSALLAVHRLTVNRYDVAKHTWDQVGSQTVLGTPVSVTTLNGDIFVIAETGDAHGNGKFELVAQNLDHRASYATPHVFGALESFADQGQPLVVATVGAAVMIGAETKLFDSESHRWKFVAHSEEASRLFQTAIAIDHGIIVWGGRDAANPAQDRNDGTVLTGV